MPIYVTLSHFTDQGIKNIKDTVKRSEAFKNAAKAAGVTVKEIFGRKGNMISSRSSRDRTRRSPRWD
jgi:uncharacterized protein with GYD domain